MRVGGLPVAAARARLGGVRGGGVGGGVSGRRGRRRGAGWARRADIGTWRRVCRAEEVPPRAPAGASFVGAGLGAGAAAAAPGSSRAVHDCNGAGAPNNACTRSALPVGGLPHAMYTRLGGNSPPLTKTRSARSAPLLTVALVLSGPPPAKAAGVRPLSSQTMQFTERLAELGVAVCTVEGTLP